MIKFRDDWYLPWLLGVAMLLFVVVLPVYLMRLVGNTADGLYTVDGGGTRVHYAADPEHGVECWTTGQGGIWCRELEEP